MRKRTQYLLTLVPLEILVVAGVFLVSLFLFFFIIYAAVYRQTDVFDEKVIHFFSTHASAGLMAVMEKITFFGSTTFLLPAYLGLVAWQLLKKKYSYAIDIAVIALSSTAVMFAFKEFFHRHRPALPVIKGVNGYSFPSGHSLSSFIFCTILVYLVWKGTLSPALKYCLMLLLLLCPFVIGLSRIVLNVHYATDVIGGFCLAIVWIILSFLLLKRIRKNNPPAATSPVL